MAAGARPPAALMVPLRAQDAPVRAERAWAPLASGDLHQRELAALDLLVAELAVEDVALVVEIAGPRGAVVVDLLAGRDRLEAVDGVVDRLAAALGDLADVVLDGDRRWWPWPTAIAISTIEVWS